MKISSLAASLLFLLTSTSTLQGFAFHLGKISPSTFSQESRTRLLTKTFVSTSDKGIRAKGQDEVGLPFTYEKEMISQYWANNEVKMNLRFSQVLPLLDKLATFFTTEEKIDESRMQELCLEVRLELERLGPTFVKAGQIMVGRPDILSDIAIDELSLLEDSIVPLEKSVVLQQIEKELGKPSGTIFKSISSVPVTATGFSQVHFATLNDGKDTRVSVKVQRPDALSTVRTDLYALTRMVEVIQALVESYAPQQRINYIDLLNEWAIELFDELDFQNEACNQQDIRQIFIDNDVQGVVIPRVFDDLCTRRVLVSEWMDGQKLNKCTPEQTKEIFPLVQEAFFVQLFDAGIFLCDLNSSDIVHLREPTSDGHTVALTNFGSIASIDQAHRNHMMSVVVNLVYENYASLVDGFFKLNLLSENSNLDEIIPLIENVLGRYVNDRDAEKQNSRSGRFQGMVKDTLNVVVDIPFSIPLSFTTFCRAITNLERIALTGDKNYNIIKKSYTFIARKLRYLNPELPSLFQKVLQNETNFPNLDNGTTTDALTNNANNDNNKTEYANSNTEKNSSSIDFTAGEPDTTQKSHTPPYNTVTTTEEDDFFDKATRFLAKLTKLFAMEGRIDKHYIPELSREARLGLQELGSTFIKMGKMLSARPDVLPKAALDELSLLQDTADPFELSVAVQQIESELGGPFEEFFTSINNEPVAVESLAQSYLATLDDGKDTKVMVKVQRPNALDTVSKELLLLKRAAGTFQGLLERFAPKKRLSYTALVNEWANILSNELNFENEARNQETLRRIFMFNDVLGVTVPRIYPEMCTRAILVSEWVDGEKLSDCTPEQIKQITPEVQEAFLVQLFEAGFIHGDPNPNNILRLQEPTAEGATIALINCGSIALVKQTAVRDRMISSLINLANKDYASLIDDFVEFNILPKDCDRATLIISMEKELSPSSSRRYEQMLRRKYGMAATVSSQVGVFEEISQSVLKAIDGVPFYIPHDFTLLCRALVTLEGIALIGDGNYSVIKESYPFIARKLLSDERPEIDSALKNLLCNRGSNEDSTLKVNRLFALLNNAAGFVNNHYGEALVDLDLLPDEGISFVDGLKFVLSDNSESLRDLLEEELDNVVDILVRQIVRKGADEAVETLTKTSAPIWALFNIASPKWDEIPLPIVLPLPNGEEMSASALPSLGLLTKKQFVAYFAPELSRGEEMCAIELGDVASNFFREDLAELIRGNGVLSVRSARMVFDAVQSGIFGRTELFGEENVQKVLQEIGSLLPEIDDSSGIGSLSEWLEATLEALDEEERSRLDIIANGLVQRSIKKAIERLAGVPRFE